MSTETECLQCRAEKDVAELDDLGQRNGAGLSSYAFRYGYALEALRAIARARNAASCARHSGGAPNG